MVITVISEPRSKLSCWIVAFNWLHNNPLRLIDILHEQQVYTCVTNASTHLLHVVFSPGTTSTCRGRSCSRLCWTSEAAWSSQNVCWAAGPTLRSSAPKEWPWEDSPDWQRAVTTPTRQPSPPTMAAVFHSCPGSLQVRWRATQWSGWSTLRLWMSAGAPFKGKVSN